MFYLGPIKYLILAHPMQDLFGLLFPKDFFIILSIRELFVITKFWQKTWRIVLIFVQAGSGFVEAVVGGFLEKRVTRFGIICIKSGHKKNNSDHNMTRF